MKEEEAAEMNLSRDTGTADVEKKKDPKLFKNLRELLWLLFLMFLFFFVKLNVSFLIYIVFNYV